MMTIESRVTRAAGFACALFAALCSSASAQPRDLSAELALGANEALPVGEETYELPAIQLPLPSGDTPPGLGIPSEMTGLVIAPDGVPGTYPLAIFIHGQAPVCVDAEQQPNSDGVCANGTKVPNYRGYVRYQRALAQRGFVTLSVSLNGVISSFVQMDEGATTQLMAAVVEAHLRRWSAWAGGQDRATAPQLLQRGVTPDLSQLMLIGHSRGGAAANQVALRSVTDALPWKVRAQVLIAPTATHRNPAPSVPVVVLLPECDGDVTDLQGQAYVDRARDLTVDGALRSAVWIGGANHKFFNAEWDAAVATVPAVGGDDAETLSAQAPQSACRPGSPTRLSGDSQRALGELFITAAASGLIRGNQAILPLLDGSAACAGVSCGASVATHALGGRKQPLLIPPADSKAQSDSSVTLTPCFTARSSEQPSACITTDMPKFNEVTRTPHFGSPIPPNVTPRPAQEPSDVALRLDWTDTASAVSVPLTQTQLAPDASEIALRIIGVPGQDAPAFDVALVDAAGQAQPLGNVSLRAVSSADAASGAYWAQEVRLPLTAASRAAAPVALQLAPRTPRGRAWLLDAYSYGGAAAATRSVARVELASDAQLSPGGDKFQVSVQVFGRLDENADIYYYVPGLERASEGRISIPAGTSKLAIELPVPQFSSLYLIGVRGAVATRLVEQPALPLAEPEAGAF